MTSASMSSELPSDLSEDDVRRLAYGLGLTIPDEDLSEVTYRYTALLEELNKLRETDLTGVDPSPMAPFEEVRQNDGR